MTDKYGTRCPAPLRNSVPGTFRYGTFTNVPVVEAEQVVESLENRGVPVEYVLFADEGHGFRKTANRITATVSIVEWFRSYLTAGE